VKLVILITARTERTLDIAEAWQQAGASGVTILEGYGLRRLQEQLGIRDDLPLMPSLATLMHQQEISTHVLVSVVGDSLAGQLYQATVEILGDLTLPDNGFIFTLDVGNTLGLRYE
jgi:hypothetical protein